MPGDTAPNVDPAALAAAMAKALRGGARAVGHFFAPPADSPGAMAVAGVRSLLPGGGPYQQEFDRYNSEAAPSWLYSPDERFGSVVGDPAAYATVHGLTIPGPTPASQARTQAMTMEAVMAGALRTVGKRYDPTLHHGGIEEVRVPDMSKSGTHGAELGRGFYTSRPVSLAEEYAMQHEAPEAVVSSFKLNPGERVFETGYRPERSHPDDVRAVLKWLREQPDGQLPHSGASRDQLIKSIEGNGYSPDWIDAAYEYAHGNGAKTLNMGSEFVTSDPAALRFLGSKKWRQGEDGVYRVGR